jgi:hypothetical protein
MPFWCVRAIGRRQPHCAVRERRLRKFVARRLRALGKIVIVVASTGHAPRRYGGEVLVGEDGAARCGRAHAQWFRRPLERRSGEGRQSPRIRAKLSRVLDDDDHSE